MMSRLLNCFETEASGGASSEEAVPDIAAAQDYAARLFNFMVGMSYGIGVSGGLPFFANAQGVSRFLSDYGLREGKEVDRYKGVAPVDPDYVSLLEQLPAVVGRAFRLSDTGFPMDDPSGSGACAVAAQVALITRHPLCPIGTGVATIPAAYRRQVLKVAQARAVPPDLVPDPRIIAARLSPG